MNIIGLQTLIEREVGRFMKVYMQTLLSPLVTTVLFFAIFSLGLPKGEEHLVMGVPFLQFLAPGLVMMSMAQNAFSNTSSSLIIAKVQGNIVDTLMAPLGAFELLTGYLVGGVVRGFLVGVVSIVGLAFFIPIGFAHIWAILAFGILGCTLMAALGLAGGLWADKFDHMAAITNFIVTPLTFLSGTFYTIDRLPEQVQHIARFNPFFHMIDGFRYGFVGAADHPVWISFAVLSFCTTLVVLLAWRLLALGYKIKS